MDKRGQVYVLAAIIMSIIIFGMVSVSNKALQENIASDFERIANNYATETAKLVNSIAGEEEILPAFRNFTLLFASYAKAQSPRFELISIFDYNNNLYIGNFLKERIIVRCNDGLCNDIPPIEGCYSNVPAVLCFNGLCVDQEIRYQDVIAEGGCEKIGIPSASIQQITISIANVAYQFDLRKDQPEIIIVGWETNARQRKVFTKGSFITSTGDATTLADYCADTAVACTEAPKYSYCDAACKPKCPLINNEDECEANSSDCSWSASTVSCVNL